MAGLAKLYGMTEETVFEENKRNDDFKTLIKIEEDYKKQCPKKW